MTATIKHWVSFFSLIIAQSSAFACDVLAKEFSINTYPSHLAIIYSAPPLRKSGEGRMMFHN